MKSASARKAKIHLRKIIEQLKRFRLGRSLGGLDLRQMIEEGRR